ncbi:MAG: PD-(D/E)XK nuclease family protein [Candidatus Bathyarchaeota archaeon]|nr:PD-(D/E)XK nuclease family protein [Candidatus Bathyarchaeota archaeon]
MSENVGSDGFLEEALKRIGEAISNSLKREAEKPTFGVYRPSLISACILRQWFIYKKGLAISEEKAGIFKIGELFHNFLENALKTSQIEVLAVEVPIQILLPLQPAPLWINGKADALIRVKGEGEKYVAEFKSIRRLPEQPLRHHVEQLHFYLAALNCQAGFIIYLEKSALRHSVFPVKFEQAVFNALIDRAQRLHKALIDNEKPEPDAQSWECRFCEFKNECKKEAGQAHDRKPCRHCFAKVVAD